MELYPQKSIVEASEVAKIAKNLLCVPQLGVRLLCEYSDLWQLASLYADTFSKLHSETGPVFT